MIAFSADSARCTACSICVKNCPRKALHMENAIPVLDPALCMGCQHCMAICPTGAVSIQGHTADECLPLKGNYPEQKQLETLIRGRRSIRRFKQQNVDHNLLDYLLATAAHSPTASNRRGLHLTVFDTMDTMNAFRKEIYRRLARPNALDRLGNSPLRSFLDLILTKWNERGTDGIFRGAPHCIFVSNHRESGYNMPVDPTIFLTTFELMAQTCGVGTLWCGLLYSALEFVIPEFKAELAIPETHALQYTMLFGYPDIQYLRSASQDPFPVQFLHKTEWNQG